MAELINPPHHSGAVNRGEQRAIDFLVENLSDYFTVIPNIELIGHAGGATQSWEFDIVVVASHGVYNIEVKDWAGVITGNHHYWYLGKQERPNPFKTLRKKNIVLQEAFKRQDGNWKRAWITNLVILSHDTALIHDDLGNSEDLTFMLDQDLLDFLNDPSTCRTNNPDKIIDIQDYIRDFLTGHFQKDRKTTVLDYEIVEVLSKDEAMTEYLCKPQRGATENRYRIKAYSTALNGLSFREREIEIQKIQHQQTALQRIGNHPNIFQVTFYLDKESNLFYETSQYMEENTLLATIENSTLPIRQKIEIIRNVAKALNFIHENSIFHRDIAPENIFIQDGIAMLSNFGKSFFFGDNGTSNKGYTVYPTLSNIEPTPYMPWELVKEGDAGSYTDLYALGIVIYHLFSGELPFSDCEAFDAMGNKLPENKKLSVIDKSIPVWVDELIDKLVLGEWEDRLQKAEEVIAFIDEQTATNSQTPPPLTPNDTVEESTELKAGLYMDSFLFMEELGKGGFSTVFKVRHTIEGVHYALKVFNPSVDVDSVIDEYNGLKNSVHPNVVKYVFSGSLQNGQFYTLMEFLDGENLSAYTSNGKNIPINLIFNVAEDILSALVFMQSKDILHRDLKPHNIVWDNNERFVLIDFNVAAKRAENQMNVGTSLYLPPDLVVDSRYVNWDGSADTFGLGVSLYELITKKHPFGKKVPRNNQTAIALDADKFGISKEFSDFIMKAIETKKENRFENAAVMRTALETVRKAGLYKKEVLKPTDISMKTEDFVNELNTLYSQSRFSNAGTRGLDAFAKATYIQTKLDLKLRPAILDGLFKLVIITGNAGDGKTAFIQQIETAARQRKDLSHGNGATFKIGELVYESNYDGSQDEGNKTNDNVLKDFLIPFENTSDFKHARAGRVIAINEGRLVEYLQGKSEYKALYKIIDEYFYSEGTIGLPEGLLIVNLNLRSVVGEDKDNPESIFRKQVNKIVAPSNWKDCERCPAKAHCFIHYNAQTLGDKTSGSTVIGRMEMLLKTIHLRQELHITMRDVRSLIAFWITRDHSCQSMQKTVAKAESVMDVLPYYYFNISDNNAIDSGNKTIG
jgi:serine/threonine protein kinase